MRTTIIGWSLMLQVLTQEPSAAGDASTGAGDMATLKNGEGEIIANKALPGEPTEKPKYGTFGDPQVFTCVSARSIPGYVTKAAPDVLRQEVGTITFMMNHGVKVVGRVIKVQTRTTEENGRIVGKGKLELTFAQSFARSTPAVTLSAEGQEWHDRILSQWKAFRDANKYPVVLLTKPEAGAAGSSVED